MARTLRGESKNVVRKTAIKAKGESTGLNGAARGSKAKAKKSIEIPALEIQSARITLVGDSPLISHAWSRKAKQQMLDKQMKKAKQAKPAKDPFGDFCASLYWLGKDGELLEPPEGLCKENDLDDTGRLKAGSFGFPAVAFKQCVVEAAMCVEGINKTDVRRAMHVSGDMVEIKGDKPRMREDMVRLSGMGSPADIRYRGEFVNWHVDLNIRFNPNLLSLEQLVNLFNNAGFAVGIGEWRVQKNGNFGMFSVQTGGE